MFYKPVGRSDGLSNLDFFLHGLFLQKYLKELLNWNWDFFLRRLFFYTKTIWRAPNLGISNFLGFFFTGIFLTDQFGRIWSPNHTVRKVWAPLGPQNPCISIFPGLFLQGFFLRTSLGASGSLKYTLRKVWASLGPKTLVFFRDFFLQGIFFADQFGRIWSPNHTVRKVWAPLGPWNILCVKFGRPWASKPWYVEFSGTFFCREFFLRTSLGASGLQITLCVRFGRLWVPEIYCA